MIPWAVFEILMKSLSRKSLTLHLHLHSFSLKILRHHHWQKFNLNYASFNPFPPSSNCTLSRSGSRILRRDTILSFHTFFWKKHFNNSLMSGASRSPQFEFESSVSVLYGYAARWDPAHLESSKLVSKLAGFWKSRWS